MSEKSTPHRNKEYEERISYMKKHIQAWQWESSAKIMAFLHIYGKLQASELRELLELKGEKSIFKALKVLLDANRVAKEVDETDARTSYYYTVDDGINDPPMDEEFIEYLHQKGELHLLSDYFSAANISSIGFIKAMTDILKADILNEKSDRLHRFLNHKLFLELILSMEDAKSFRESFAKFLQTEIRKYGKGKEDQRDKLVDPIGLYIAFIPM